ncbi:MAG: lytic murein transglycosylase [Candidatus Pacebacteria bacterium]|nr:lytic murein transglycosylase [Candidatus Paceibacterota bacterium]
MTRKVVSFIFVFFFATGLVFIAQKSEAAFDCLTLTSSSSEKNKAFCRSELADIEAELARLLDLQKKQQKQTGTLTGDVNYLTSQINALKKKIQARSLVITQLKVAIIEKVSTINSLEKKIAREHESIAQLLRNTNEFDNENIVHLILSDQSISDFYSDLESYTSIKNAVQKSVNIIRGVKTETEVAKTDLEKKQNAETDAKAELESAQKKIAVSEAEKKQLLAVSKQTEAEYQKLAAEKQAQAAKIRSALFPLAGISTKIDFGTALVYANEASKATSIDPAFLLAILTQESNLGANVGQCLLTDLKTGAGVGKNTGTPFSNVMKPMGLAGRKGDIDDFLAITSKLGRNWAETPVSCPIAGVAGYGGAMGPAQFIPSTWSGYISRLKNLLGHDADPWAPRDAFFASATFLTDLGAIGNSVSAQSVAACRYYGTGGKTCSYGKSVLNLKAKIQADIDQL